MERLREQSVWSVVVVVSLTVLIVRGIQTGTWPLVVAGGLSGLAWAAGMR